MSEWEDGFLTETLNYVSKEVRRKYAGFHALFRRTNRYAVSRQHAIAIRVDNAVERYAACLYARTLATTQANALLLERGLVSQAKMLARSALETLFALGAIAEEPTVVNKLIEGHAAEQKRVAKNMLLWQHPKLKQIATTKAGSGGLQPFLDSPAAALSAFDLAQKAGLEDWYRTVYMVYSWPVHGAAVDLDQHAVVGPDGDVSEFRNEPEIEGQESTWLCDIEILLKSLNFLGKVFPNVDKTVVDSLYAEAHSLHNEEL